MLHICIKTTKKQNSFHIQWYRYADIDGYDPKKHTITVFSPAKKILTPEEFFERAVKKYVGSIRDTENVSEYYTDFLN